MVKLNPYAKALKQVRKNELANRLKAKKESIEKAKKLHKAMKEARQKKKKAGGLSKKAAPTKAAPAKKTAKVAAKK